ncbi:hypothetical protein AGABI1DRAFT_115948 [Agaricus bisporus var. burnettii JB137-S8]|uniref:Pali-domain-containing protein n=1 Tax=Agaricus bisporus var. burnettii (strain JB137-S8 / ATCC MYA-4627 / FGSC 10392) TaxID=597362 RepID=K5XNH6_AGABU|nr:uncharacterized protein AGABI1DRAFT_115948 [Agaricus bisporus var. burnettii JB137-S8]EKM76195.1 hypothetical protein AGABI1DRAFT_115948 [Agaricus bisporus var. burnettii JB137-S8]
MARIFCIPAVAIIFAAFVLNLIVSISLPYLPALDFTRTHFQQVASENGQNNISQLRFGIWAPCSYNEAGDRTCVKQGHAYGVTVANQQTDQVTIAPSWTRGLAIHPVAAVVSLLAVLLALSQHLTIALWATLIAWLAGLLTFIAFLCDVVLFAHTRTQFKKLNLGTRTIPGPGFWITLVAMILLFLGGITTCLGRIKDRRTGHKDFAAMSSARTQALKADEIHDKKYGHSDDIELTGPKHWASKFKFNKH